MLVNGLKTSEIAERITRDLPFGLWCADVDQKKFTFYNKAKTLLEVASDELSFLQFEQLIREDYRGSVSLGINEALDTGEYDIAFPTNSRWIKMKMTHFDTANRKAYGYLLECFTESERSADSERLVALFNRQNQLIHHTFDKIESGSMESITEKILADIAAAIGADRISVMEYNYFNNTQNCTFETTRQGAESRINVLKDIASEALPWINSEVSHKDCVYIYDLKETEQDKQTQLDILCSTDVKSMIIVPLVRKNEILGYMLVDFIKKNFVMSHYEGDWLKSISRFVEFSLLMNNHNKRSSEEKYQLKSMIDNMPFGYLHLKFTYDSDQKPDGIIILRTNTRLETMLGMKDMVGKTISQVFGREGNHILSVCTQIARNGEKQIVDDFIYSNGVTLSADIFMANFNEFICLTSDNSHSLYVINHETGKEPAKEATVFDKDVQYMLRTHLNAIVGFADLLDYENEEKNKAKYMSIIKENAQSLLDSSFIKDTLAADTPAPAKEAEPEETPKAEENRRKKILVAEDTESNYMLVSYILRAEYDIVWARDGVEALEKYESEHPDLILMDVRMPRIGGLTATGRIREKDKQTPIIALTAFAFESDKAKTLEAGCTDFIAKPINAKSLKDIIKKYI